MATITITGSYNKSALIFSSNNAKIYEDHASGSDSGFDSESGSEHGLNEYNNNLIVFLINKKKIVIENPDPEESLINFLRDTLHLTGTKVSCTQGFCGVCTIMVSYKDTQGNYKNVSMNSCLLKLAKCNGMSITTIEGLNPTINDVNNKLHPIQDMFYNLFALQCGYCTPGFIMRIYSSVLDSANLPTFAEIDNHLSGNICRCTGMRPIVEAYKCVLISIVESNSLLSSVVTGSDAEYIKQYTTLKTLWNINGTNPSISYNSVNTIPTGLPSYNLAVWNTTTSANTTIKAFLDGFVHPLSKYKSKIWNYGTNVANPNPIYGVQYTVNTMHELNELVEDLVASPNYSLTDITFFNGLTSHGVPTYADRVRNKVMIDLRHLKELYSVSVLSDHVYGAGVSQNTVQKTLSESTDSKYKNIAQNIFYIASPSVRNLASWSGSLMMTMKYGFRGDWATILRGANATFNYNVYEAIDGCVSVKTGKSYLDLFADVTANKLVLVVSVTIPKAKTNERFVYARVAQRLDNAQAFANAVISAITADNGATFTEMVITVGAIDGVTTSAQAPSLTFTGDNHAVQKYDPVNHPATQQAIVSGSVSKASDLVSLFEVLDTLKYVGEFVYVDKHDNVKATQNLVKGMVTKFITGESDMDYKKTKRSAYGKQSFNSGNVGNTNDDYPVFSLDTTNPHQAHKLIKQGGLTQLPGDGSFNIGSNRDQLRDFIPNDESFNAVGKALPLNAAFYKVTGRTQYSTEVPIDALQCEMIEAHIVKGTIDLNSVTNQNVLEKWRKYPGINSIIVYDTWFKENMGTLNPFDISYGISIPEGIAQVVNTFNLAGFTYSKSTHFTSPITILTLPLVTKIENYGQIIGCVVADNVELARYVSAELSKAFIYAPDLSYSISLLTAGGNTYDFSGTNNAFNITYQPDNVLNDTNTKSRINSSIFGAANGRMCGPTFDISNNFTNFQNLKNSGLIPPDAEYIDNNFYRLSDNTTALLPNYNNDKYGAFYTPNCNGPLPDASCNNLGTGIGGGFTQAPVDALGKLDLSGYYHGYQNTFLKTLGCNIDGMGPHKTGTGPILYKDPSNNPLYQPTNWLKTNYNNWDVSSGTYVGTFAVNSQAGMPLEPTSITVTINNNTVECYMGLQDSYLISIFLYIARNLLPKYKIAFYDSSGQVMQTPQEYQVNLNLKSMASGGSFGTKYLFWYISYLPCVILSALYSQKPVKYIQNWRFSEQIAMGRYPSVNKTSMEVDRTTKKITSVVIDGYHINGVNNSMLDAESSTEITGQWFNTNTLTNFASRQTIVSMNLGTTGAIRTYGQSEGKNITEVIRSKGAALLQIPQYQLTLNDMIYEENRTHLTNIAPSGGNGMILFDYLREVVVKDQLIAILKNLKSYSYPVSSVNFTNLNTKSDISNAFGDYYQNNIAVFNNNNTFKKRGMSLVVGRYNISHGFNANQKCKIELETQKRLIKFSLPIVDHGTGSYYQNIQVLADVLKVDPNIIVYNGQDSTLFESGGFQHPGSTSRVSYSRATLAGGIKFLHAMLERYPVFDYNTLAGPGIGAIVAGIAGISSFTPNTPKVRKWPYDGSTFNDTSYNLAIMSGKEVVELWNKVNANQVHVAIFQSTKGYGIGISGEVVPPDLHRELIIRTLEFEYTAGLQFIYPTSLFTLPYYLQLVDPSYNSSGDSVFDNGGKYIQTITKDMMMQRWPMIVTFITSTFNSATDPGSYMWPYTPAGAAFAGNPYTIPDNNGVAGASANLFAVGGQFLAFALGGKKLDPTNPNKNCGSPELLLNAVSASVFGAQSTSCPILGMCIQDPHWVLDTTSLTAQFETYGVMACALTVTEVDMLTGEWINKRTEVITDTGRSINPRADIGQVEGGWVFGSGYTTSENSSNYQANGEKIQRGLWNYKMPTAKTTPEVFNAMLLNVNDSYIPGSIMNKGVGEPSTIVGASLVSSIRDAVRQFRQDVTVKLNTLASGDSIRTNNPFSSDNDEDNKLSCNYVFDMYEATVEKIRLYTALPNNVMNYLINN